VKTDISFWLTKPDKSALLQKQDVSLLFNSKVNSFPTIDIDTSVTYQVMDGFGFTLTGGSATLINGLSAPVRNELLKELFSADANSIGISYLRISIGASDLSATVFSYNDLPAGETDLNLDHFSLEPEKTDLIPVLKAILAINPKI
jgi:glucosylceramidase